MPYNKNSRDKYGNCFKRGNTTEELFAEIAESKGYTVVRASWAEEVHQHFDFIISKKSEKKIEVKGRKKTNRAGKLQDDLIWIEFKNTGGKKGWLYGEADIFGFETEDSFVLIYKKHLIDLADELVDLESFVDISKKALYKAYRRKDRPNELISMIRMSDILSKPHQIWKKP